MKHLPKYIPTFCFLILSLSFVARSANMTASDKEKYQKKGLTEVEWEQILDAHMPEWKVDDLLKAGVSITEYFRYPWLNYGITEQEWIKRRRSGRMESDIEAENRPSASNQTQVVTNFFLPGYHQYKRHQNLKGAAMTSLAAGGLLAILGGTLLSQEFIWQPMFVVVPAMLWSSMDIGFQIQKETNPDAARFSDRGTKPTLRASLTLSFEL